MQKQDDEKAKHFGLLLQGWISDWERAQSRFRVPNRELATLIGVTEATFGRWIKGGNLPEPENCIALARVLGISAEMVLQAAGHPILTPLSFESLISAVQEEGKGWGEQHFLLQYLQMTRSPEWQASRSHWKQDAEMELLSSGDARAKANGIARTIYSWFVDPARETPLEQKGLPN